MIASRRQLLGQAVAVAGAASVGLFLGCDAFAQSAAPACYDPASLPFTQKSRRKSLGYVEASSDPARQCGVCAFFTATATGCGSCQMLSGGPVNGGGVCNSFAKRAAK